MTQPEIKTNRRGAAGDERPRSRAALSIAEGIVHDADP